MLISVGSYSKTFISLQFLSKVITGDKTWIYGNDHKIKQQSHQRSPSLLLSRKARQIRSVWRACWVFFNIYGIPVFCGIYAKTCTKNALQSGKLEMCFCHKKVPAHCFLHMNFCLKQALLSILHCLTSPHLTFWFYNIQVGNQEEEIWQYHYDSTIQEQSQAASAEFKTQDVCKYFQYVQLVDSLHQVTRELLWRGHQENGYHREKCTIWKLYDQTMYGTYFTLLITYLRTQFIYSQFYSSPTYL